MHHLPLFVCIVLLLAACGTATAPGSDSNQSVSTPALQAATTAPEVDAAEELPAEATTNAVATMTPTVIDPTQGATEEAQVRKQYSSAPAMQIDPNKQYVATIETNKGTITAELYAKTAPKTVNNFVTLARDGYYEGVIFHRIIPGFVIQGGDPTGTGAGGPGYQFEDERVTRPYETGSLAMANAGPNTNGSQFFIVLEGGASMLQPLYNHFGKVTEGMDVVNEIATTPTGAQDRPLEPVVIENITIEER